MGFKWLISWMVDRCIHTPGELNPSEYIEDLPRYIAEANGDDRDTTEAQVRLALHIIPYFWSERRLLNKWGVSSLTEDPFRHHGIYYYGQAIATKLVGWIPPLPDEVAIPLFNEVAWWLGQPAEDVIRLLEYVQDPLAGAEIEVATLNSKTGIRAQMAGDGKVARIKRAKRFLAEFKFSLLPNETNPWHAPLDSAFERDGDTPLVEARVLFEAVREACALSIQGMSGMRISELLGIEAGLDVSTGLPKGVRVESTATGLYEVFIIRTVMSKTEKGLPREMDWVLGMRPQGSQEEPLPVRALRLLNRLHVPWRDCARTTRLLFHGGVGATLPLKTTVLGAMDSASMRDGMKRFIARWVDLSALPDQSKHRLKDNNLVEWRESRGTIFKSHMLRKSWAQFMFAVDPLLKPAIQLQFHHLSLAMTDTGYISSNLLLVNDMDSVATQATQLMILEMLNGSNPLAGKMGEQLEQATQDLAARVKGLPTSDAYKEVVRFCESAQLPIFFSPHGACMPLQTHAMRCHDEAGTSLLLRKQPNARTRQPSLCAGCNCFVLDARHSDFWVTRYLDNWLAYKRAERRGHASDFKVIKERALQAGKLLKKIGINVSNFDSQIEMTLEAENVAS
jgi:integrase